MRVAGLFSGIGGFELAFSQAGFSTALLAEIDPDARRVLKHRFPDVKLSNDVAALTEIGHDVSVMTAGFPCQNLSMAGDKTGIDGLKSGIVGKIFDLIDKSSIPTVVIENVYFMLQLDRGRGMRWLVEQFELQGYKWAYRVLDTIGFGLPQRRRRVYLVASREIDPRGVLFADEAPSKLLENKPNLMSPLGFYWTEGRSGIGLTVDGIPPIKVGSSLGIPSAPAVLFPDGAVLMPSLAACERLQGFPAGWTTVPDPGEGRRPEWRLIGNAVSVPVARWVAERIKEPGPVLEFECTEMVEGQRWPDAAWNTGEGRVIVKANDTPMRSPRPSIAEFRDLTWTRLSDRALNGYVKRVVEGGLRVPEGFVDALRAAERKISHAA
jgi:DNA (cytosine-5)-methyltransferase 1